MSSGFTFGSPAAQKTTAFGFGSTTTTPVFGTPGQTATAGGLTFGSLAQAGSTGGGLPFTTPQPQQQQQQQTGIVFGTPATNQPGLSFGTAAATPAAAPQLTGLGFGSLNPAPQTGLTFGSPATNAPVFGAAPAAPVFGQSSGLGFGTPAATTAQPGFSFGTPSSSAAPALAPAPAPATTQPSLGFGASGLMFGTPVSTAVPTATTTVAPPGALSFGLGAPASTAVKPLSLFGPSTTATIATAATTVPAVSATTAATSAPTLGFSLGLPAATTAQSAAFGLGSGAGAGIFGLGAKPFGSLPLGTTATTSAATTTTASSVGLGGVDPTQSKLGLAGGGAARADSKAVKENQMPNEIMQTIENFKTFLKAQKNLSSDVARGSPKLLNKVQEETESLKQMLASLQNGIQRSSALVSRLKADTAKCLQNAEMAQRTHEIPPGLQYDNTAPIKYFMELVAGFEREMQMFKLEICSTEKHLQSLLQPMPLTCQELALAMRRLHDSFVALAGRVQAVHQSVEMEKNQYLLLRKYFLKDSSNVFEEGKKGTAPAAKPKGTAPVAAGPTPFSALGGQHGFGLLSSSATIAKTPLSSGWSSAPTPTPQPQAQPQLQPSQLSTAPAFGNTLFTGSSGTGSLTSPQPVENQSFNLQKPPLGNKRGKR